MDMRGRLLELIEETAAGDPQRPDEDARPAAVGRIEAATSLIEEVKVILQALVDQARADGVPWAQIAAALGLANASSAHYLYGPKGGLAPEKSREVKLADLRERVASLRRSMPRPDPLPGLSAIEAGRRLHIDRRTVKQRAMRGEIETTTVTSSTGTPITRYLLPDEATAPKG